MHNEILTIGPVTIYGYGLMIGLGVLCCIWMGMHRAKKNGLAEDAVIDIAIYGLIAGFLGAKFLYVIVEWKAFIKDPLSVLGSEGFVVYGGISMGVLAAILYCKKKGYRFLAYFDLLCASIALAQGFGRIGCFLAGCCYGRETTSSLGVVFPAGSLAPAGIKLLPTQLFSSAGDFGIMFALLWHYNKCRKYVGETGFVYMLLYGIGRFILEFWRNDNRGAVGSLSTSQFISIFIVAAALLLMAYYRKNGIKVEDLKNAEALEKTETAEQEG